MDSAICRINHYPLDNSVGFASVYPLDSGLSGGWRYQSFEQLGPGCFLLSDFVLSDLHASVTAMTFNIATLGIRCSDFWQKYFFMPRTDESQF